MTKERRSPITTLAPTEATSPGPSEFAAVHARSDSSADRLGVFQQARFGMFIHWGLYAIPAAGEWVQFARGVPGVEYEAYASQFNPTRFDAAEWVALAKDAGQKYLVFTAKHHDGFCMWNTKLTDYNVVEATPFGRDPLQELAVECDRQGVTLGVYYSVKDWHHPQYPTLYTRRTKQHPDGFHGFPNPEANFLEYLDYMQSQLRELMTCYGSIGSLFFDWYGDAFEDEQERRRGQEIIDMVRELQPGCVINDRLGGIGADYVTPEQAIPSGTVGRPFEVCMTIGESWGYAENDDVKHAGTLIRNLSDIAGKGGNYLLNVGPSPDGTVGAGEAQALRELGQWLSVNGEAIYGTTAGPSMHWEDNIKMVTRRPGREYLHVVDWPADQRVFYFDFRHRLRNAYLLADPARTPLQVDVHPRSVMIHVPAEAPDPVNSIIVLTYDE
jgi:alpha-L-fucosidase